VRFFVLKERIDADGWSRGVLRHGVFLSFSGKTRNGRVTA